MNTIDAIKEVLEAKIPFDTYGMEYMGMATNAKEAEDLNKTV